ncbi:MAG: ATP-binding cassette domain-containing protein [Pseudomonadota bacterium]
MKLRVQNLRFEVVGTPLLDVPELALELDAVTVLTGPNGSGKSLFLAALHGVLPGATGTVTWNGAPAQDTRPNRGMLLQRNPILRRSVFENLAFALRASHTFTPDKVERMLKTIGLADRAQDPAAHLSGGERQRLCLGRALIIEPNALLLDEPTSALDAQATTQIFDLIAKTAKTTPILMTSHSRDVIQELADQRLHIEEGRLTDRP